jgi:DHA2 family multidrug resistance protein
VLQTLPAAFDASTQAGLAALNIEVPRQAAMIAYVADFHVMMLITLVAMPLLLLVRKPSGDAAARGGDVADVAH